MTCKYLMWEFGVLIYSWEIFLLIPLRKVLTPTKIIFSDSPRGMFYCGKDKCSFLLGADENARHSESRLYRSPRFVVSYGSVCYLGMRDFVRNIPDFQEVMKLILPCPHCTCHHCICWPREGYLMFGHRSLQFKSGNEQMIHLHLGHLIM